MNATNPQKYEFRLWTKKSFINLLARMKNISYDEADELFSKTKTCEELMSPSSELYREGNLRIYLKFLKETDAS